MILACGNPARGDDALGPALLDRLRPPPAGVELLEDYQLMLEHALDLAGRERVLFVDADAACRPPYRLEPVPESAAVPFSSHSLSPGAVLAVYRQVTGQAPPPAWVLGVRGQAFELGQGLSPAARAHLDAAERQARQWLAGP